jgi:hypothetical protein
MNRCLQLPELAQHIFEYSDSCSALAAVAVTCHTLSDLALDALWGIYGSLDALLLLLPDDLMDKEDPWVHTKSRVKLSDFMLL